MVLCETGVAPGKSEVACSSDQRQGVSVMLVDTFHKRSLVQRLAGGTAFKAVSRNWT